MTQKVSSILDMYDANFLYSKIVHLEGSIYDQFVKKAKINLLLINLLLFCWYASGSVVWQDV